MVHIIIKKSTREIRERRGEVPAAYRGKVGGWARDVEEADRAYREWGRDNPNNPVLLAEDGGKADRELRNRTLRNAGKNPEEYS